MFFGVLSFVLLAVIGGVFTDENAECSSIISRQEWSIQPPNHSIDSLTLPVHYAIVSDTGTEPCFTRPECALRTRLIQIYSTGALGWDDIGYSFLIGGDGNVYEGRGWTKRGAHTVGWNDKSLGIAFIGSYNEVAPSQEMLTAARKLLACGKANGSLSNDFKVLIHRQVSNSHSPGEKLFNVIRNWPEWTSRVSLNNDSATNISANDENANGPIIIERQQWGAQPPSRRLESLTLPVPYVIISHTAGQPCSRMVECILRVRIVQTYHIEGLGFDDIAYAFLIGGDGQVYVGRGWTLRGAHTFGWNDKSLGIAFIGNFRDVAPNQKMLAAARKLLALGKANGSLSNDFKVLSHPQVSDTSTNSAEQLNNVIRNWPEWESTDILKNDSLRNLSTNLDNEDCPIVTRQQWSAQPPSSTIENLTLPVSYAIISHTASEPCNHTNECIMKVRFMQTYHIETFGWDDIGYSFLIGGDGKIYEGRGWAKRGAHRFGWNDKSIGIAFIGTYNDVAPSEQMLATARRLLACGKANGSLSGNLKVLGHRQVSRTLSPGEQLYAIIQTWPEWVSQTENITVTTV